MMGGDIENDDAEGYGGPGSSGRGILLTIARGPNHEIVSQFLLCFKQDCYLEGSGLPFGRVIDGMETILELKRLTQFARVVITDCGEYAIEPNKPQSSSPILPRDFFDNLRKPFTFMDLSINGRPAQKIVFQLFDINCPKACENFRALCTGEWGTTGKPLHYKGTKFHLIHPHIAMDGGDFVNHDGTGGESIYGGTFPSESVGGRTGPGLLMTVCKGMEAEIGSLFRLCFKPEAQYLEGSGYAFGIVIDGRETLSELELLQRNATVEITDCGVEPNESRSSSDKKELPASNPDERSESRKRSKKSESTISEDKQNNVTESDKEYEAKVSRLQHDLTCVMLESREMKADISELKQSVEANSIETNAEILKMRLTVGELTNTIHELKRKRSKSKVDWQVIAAVSFATVAYFRQEKFRVVFRQHSNH